MSKKNLPLLMILLLLCHGIAAAELLVLPEQLTQISEETFCGDSSVTEVVIPEVVLAIGDRAFSGCENLGWVTISGKTNALGEDVFAGCAEDILIRTESGSAACDYARSHSMDYQAGTVYRALLIGQTYPKNYSLRLDGPENDVQALRTCLSGFGETPYQTTISMNVSVAGMLDAISDAFGAATENDVSLFYYSGHGVSSSDSAAQGALLAVNGKDYVTADQLRGALDQIPGRKIVIIDACYSGAMIGANAKGAGKGENSDGAAASMDAEDFTASFIAAFSRRSRSNLASDNYFVLTAASSSEECFEEELDGVTMGLFTYTVTKGLGYSPDQTQPGVRSIDVNENQVITLQEIYQYARKEIKSRWQHAQVYPTACNWFGLLRD